MCCLLLKLVHLKFNWLGFIHTYTGLSQDFKSIKLIFKILSDLKIYSTSFSKYGNIYLKKIGDGLYV